MPCPQSIQDMGDVPSNVKSFAKIALGLIDFAPSGIVERIESCNMLNMLKSRKSVADLTDEEFELFVGYLRNYRQTGTISNIDWRCKFWGTKWNSYSFVWTGTDEIKFDTAWDAPHPVIEKLAEILGCEIIHEWADENTGRNVGIRVYKHGLISSEELLDEEKRGYELAFSLCPSAAEYYEWDGSNYVCKED